MSSAQMDALIVRHLADIDTAAKRIIHNVQVEVGKALDEVAEEWADAQGWTGVFEWDENELALYPPEWGYKEPGSEDTSRSAYFYLYAGQGDDFGETSDLDQFWLTRLTGSGRGQLGFWWEYEKGVVAPRGKRWKQFVRSYIERLQGKGFTYDEESGLFFLPVRVDREALALAIENETIEDALEPLKKALDLCLGAKAIFDEMLATARIQFKSEE